MRTAPTAQLWEATRLMAAYEVWVRHLRAQADELSERVDDGVVEQTAAALLFGGSGLTAPYPDRFDDAARRLLDMRAADLEAATLYVLSPSMCDVVIAAAQTLTVDDLALLDADDLPNPTGLLVLPHPILVRAINGNLGDNRAYAWTSPTLLPTVSEAGQPTQLPAVRFTTYDDTHGPVRPDSFQDMAARTRAEGHPLPPLLPDGTRTFPYRVTPTDEMRHAQSRYGDHARASTSRWRAVNTALGVNEGDQVDDSFEYHPGDEINDPDDLFAIQFLYAFWRLCAQDIGELTDAAVGHSARLLADRAGVPAEVRVASIRTTRTTGGDGSPARDWKHRWVVRMHKVRQWYPSEQRHKVIYRGPYVKGPADKPLIGGEVVRAMTH
jgi:hypothetical protein